MRQKQNVKHNTICLEQQYYASQESFTPPLVVMVETFRRSECGVHQLSGIGQHFTKIVYLTGYFGANLIIQWSQFFILFPGIGTFSNNIFYQRCYIVSVLGQDKGYTVKYNPWPYSPSRVLIQTLYYFNNH